MGLLNAIKERYRNFERAQAHKENVEYYNDRLRLAQAREDRLRLQERARIKSELRKEQRQIKEVKRQELQERLKPLSDSVRGVAKTVGGGLNKIKKNAGRRVGGPSGPFAQTNRDTSYLRAGNGNRNVWQMGKR